jgi:Rad3-related DNA helicase
VALLDEGGDFTQANRHNALERLAKHVERLLTTRFQDMRGIIHTVSYNNAYALLRHLKKSSVASRLVLPRSEDLLEIRDMLLQQDHTVLVAPTLTEGIDLPDDLCRFILYLKCPWGHLGDAWVKARMEQDYTWYVREAVIATVQGCGRATRHDTDWSITLLLDGQFARLFSRGKPFMPQWFLDGLKQ